MRCRLLKGANKDGKCDLCCKPLTGRRRRWCSDKCSKEFYDNHRYSAARKRAKRRDGYKCSECGSKKKLEVNHIKPCKGAHSKFSCKHHLTNLITLCHECHLIETKNQYARGELRRTPKKKKSSKKRA